MGTLCTELHAKSKYYSWNDRYPKTNPPPEHIINVKCYSSDIQMETTKSALKCLDKLKFFYKNYIFSEVLLFLNLRYLTNQLFPWLGVQ